MAGGSHMAKHRADLASIAQFAASILRDADTVALRDLGQALKEAADCGCIRPYNDNSELVRIMQFLGWHKDGYVGDGACRSPRYVRYTAVSQAVLTCLPASAAFAPTSAR